VNLSFWDKLSTISRISGTFSYKRSFTKGMIIRSSAAGLRKKDNLQKMLTPGAIWV